MLDTKEIIDASTARLAARDSWRLSDEQHLDLLRKVETIANTVERIPEFTPPRWVDPDQQPMRTIRLDPRLTPTSGHPAT